MPIAVQNKVDIPINQALDGAALAGGGILPIAYVQQSEDMWCWAACGQMVFGHAQKPKSQCAIASDALGRTCCATPHAPLACNVGAWPDEVYTAQKLTTTRVRSLLDRTALEAWLAEERLVQVYFQWSSGNSHVALVVGDHGGGWFEVFDPLNPGQGGRRAYSEIVAAYGLGRWTEHFTFTY